MNYWKLIGLLFFPYFVFFSSFYLHKRESPNWFVRKYIHTTGLFMVGLFGSTLSTLDEIVIIVTILFISAIALSIHPRIQLIQSLIRMGTRSGEREKETFFNSLFTIVASLTLLYFTFEHRWIFMVAMMAVSLGDGFGEFIGKPYGKHKFKITANKSVEGSIAVFFGSLIGAVFTLFLFNIFTLQILLLVVLTSFVAMVIEAISFSFLDNLFMPASVAAILWFAI